VLIWTGSTHKQQHLVNMTGADFSFFGIYQHVFIIISFTLTWHRYYQLEGDMLISAESCPLADLGIGKGRWIGNMGLSNGSFQAKPDQTPQSRRYFLRVAPALLLVLLVVSTILSGCRPKNQTSGGSITVAGSTSVQPFAEMLAEEYTGRFPQRPPINIQGGGSSAGGRAVLTGAAEIGMLSRQPAEAEKELTAITIVHDALAVVVHPDNPVRSLSSEQIRAIFAGHISTWSSVGGSDNKIHVVSREEGSGTRTAFDELIMADTDVAARAIVQDSNGAVRQAVAQDKNAIGYISLGLVDNTVAAIEVDKVKPTLENCRAGKYALIRPFLFVVQEKLDPNSQAFIDFVLSDDGQSLLAEEGLVTVK
jgi:phosphate transport system substrate-binding protein